MVPLGDWAIACERHSRLGIRRKMNRRTWFPSRKTDSKHLLCLRGGPRLLYQPLGTIYIPKLRTAEEIQPRDDSDLLSSRQTAAVFHSACGFRRSVRQLRRRRQFVLVSSDHRTSPPTVS